MLKVETKYEMVNSWLKENAEKAPFCQSFEWEEILSREGKNIERLVVFDDNEPVAMALIEYHKLPFGWLYAYCPKGPVYKKNLELGSINNINEELIKYLSDKKCIFFRIEPSRNFAGAEKVPDFNPRATLILGLRHTPDELLANMHQKTRYNINLAQKKDLRVSDAKDADAFMALMKETGRRDKFRLHETRHYHEIIFSSLSHQLTVYYGPKAIAVAVFIGFGDTFTYVFGASDYEHRSLMAPYLIQWEGIKMGQRYDFKFYDFFGVAPKTGQQADGNYEYDNNHQYAGVTKFKQGFGGEYREDPGTFDFSISSWRYKFYGCLRALRRMI
ncbi:MAG: peptidoglycan bridge formation glycyltransferase FemA/FemB family protein [Candidatus Magasanikbacteria bacterium]|nr:peptidoglycan bridge formation glycyltransferase FemA/FemB family protein [Candidatus Magasanikbacteria bacterium]